MQEKNQEVTTSENYIYYGQVNIKSHIPRYEQTNDHGFIEKYEEYQIVFDENNLSDVLQRTHDRYFVSQDLKDELSYDDIPYPEIENVKIKFVPESKICRMCIGLNETCNTCYNSWLEEMEREQGGTNLLGEVLN